MKFYFWKHKDYYKSENSEELVEDFLKNVRSKFKPGHVAVMKCGFSIEIVSLVQLIKTHQQLILGTGL